MPRFCDDWLVGRVMFDYISGGSCACCGLAHTAALFLPNGVADLVMAVSDLETDQAQREIALLNDDDNGDDNNDGKHHPWPKELRDQVWADRVRLRQHMKKDLSKYRQFWEIHGIAFCEWLRRQPKQLVQRLFQVSRTEISQTLRERYNIQSVGYGVVLCAAMEQIAHFDLTQYDNDGPPGSIELEFERILIFDRRGGFTLKDLFTDESDDDDNDGHQGCWNEQVLDVWCRRFASLGGPKLLERGSSRFKKENDGGDDNDDDDDNANVNTTTNGNSNTPPSGPSFQSDRRILRLVIARYWADQFMKKYLGDDSSPASAGPIG